MRLIDAEALENEIVKTGKFVPKDAVLDVACMVNRAPTIEAIVPPFKLGDTVYWLNGMGFIKEYKILAIQYTFDDKRKQWRIDLGDGFMPVYPHKALYFNKEEAKKAAEIERKRFEEFFKEGAQMDEVTE